VLTDDVRLIYRVSECAAYVYVWVSRGRGSKHKTVNLEKIIIIIQTRLDYNNGRGGARV